MINCNKSIFRNSSFDAAGARARITQSKAGSQETDEEEPHAHLHHHHHTAHLHQEGHAGGGHLGGHPPHSGGSFHHSHLTSALHEVRGESIPLTPVLSEDEEAAEETKESNEDIGLRLRIDNVSEDRSGASKSGQLTEQTAGGESIDQEHSEGCADVKTENNNEGHQENNVSIKHRGSI